MGGRGGGDITARNLVALCHASSAQFAHSKAAVFILFTSHIFTLFFSVKTRDNNGCAEQGYRNWATTEFTINIMAKSMV